MAGAVPVGGDSESRAKYRDCSLKSGACTEYRSPHLSVPPVNHCRRGIHLSGRTSRDSGLVQYPRTAVVSDVLEGALLLYGAIDLLSRVIR